MRNKTLKRHWSHQYAITHFEQLQNIWISVVKLISRYWQLFAPAAKFFPNDANFASKRTSFGCAFKKKKFDLDLWPHKRRHQWVAKHFSCSHFFCAWIFLHFEFVVLRFVFEMYKQSSTDSNTNSHFSWIFSPVLYWKLTSETWRCRWFLPRGHASPLIVAILTPNHSQKRKDEGRQHIKQKCRAR